MTSAPWIARELIAVALILFMYLATQWPRLPSVLRWLRETVTSNAGLILIAVAVNLVGNEVDRLINEIPSSHGHVHSLTDVISPTSLTQVGDWIAWASADSPPAALILASTLADLIFIACYALLGSRLIRHSFLYWKTTPRGIGQVNASTAAASILLALVVLSDIFEDALLVIADVPLFRSDANTIVHQLDWVHFSYFVAGVTIAKWVAVGLFLLYLVLSDRVGARVRAFLRDALRALYAQRLVAIVVVAMCALCLLPLPDLFEQASDVYRGLFSFQGGAPVIDPRALAIVLADVLVGFMLFAIGRERARSYFLSGTGAPQYVAKMRTWILCAAIFGAFALVVGLWTNWQSLDGGLVFTVLGVLIGVAIVSVAIRIIRSSPVPEPGTTNDSELAPTVRMAGDVLLTIWVAVSLFAPMKALVTPLVLVSQPHLFPGQYRVALPWLIGFEAILFGFGVCLSVAIWRRLRNDSVPVTPLTPLTDHLGVQSFAVAARHRVVVTGVRGVRFLKQVGRPDVSSVTARAEADRKIQRAFRRWMLIVAALVIVLVLFFPSYGGFLLGPVGALILLIGCWAMIVGTLIAVLGRRTVPEIFGLLRLRSTPVVTLLIVLPIVVSAVGPSAALHALRFGPEGDVAAGEPRLQLKAAFDYWNGLQGDCSTTFTTDADTHNSVSVRPLVLVAAQGGGIRAAAWTVDVLNRLDDDGQCASKSTFLSSGASGGSIGLTTFRPTGSPVTLLSEPSTNSYDGQVALGVDVAALLTGDQIGGVTGIRVPTQSDPTNPLSRWTWHDRTALQELAWASEAPQFGHPIDLDFAQPTGFLVLNSTDAVSDCKVIISQLDLEGSPESINPDCNGPDLALSNTIDLEKTLGPCFYQLDWSTAAELSARFPVVSPPARIDTSTLPTTCNQPKTQASDIGKKGPPVRAPMQLVDGGTTDNSAIGTISDISAPLADIISTYNASANGSTTQPFVVPIILYASNEPGLDLTPIPSRTKPDALVPLTILGSAHAAELSPASWLNRAAAGYAQVCGDYSAADADKQSLCEIAVDDVRHWVPGGATIVSPSTAPAVSVPLGWTLSGFSSDRLAKEAISQATCGFVTPTTGAIASPTATTSAACRPDSGYARYGALLSLYSPGSDSVVVAPSPPSPKQG